MAGPSSQPAVARTAEKSPAAFRTISEVSNELEVPQHVLRFWESKFTQIKPLKRGGGRRYYRPEDIGLLRSIRNLLYHDGYTIKGVQRLLREGGAKTLVKEHGSVTAVSLGSTPPRKLPARGSLAATAGNTSLSESARLELREILGELEELRALLKKAGE